MKKFDLTEEKPLEMQSINLTKPDKDLVVIEKLDYLIDLLETALKLEYLKCSKD
jgi:hypothetical protein